MDRSIRILSMVRHLHEAGYERLRICSGYAHTGAWRCFITPAGNMFDNGWLPRSADGTHMFAADEGPDFFGWDGSADHDARSLAIDFLFHHADGLRQAEGRDEGYAAWFAERLHEAERGHLPAQFGGGNLALLRHAVLPPPLPSGIIAITHDFPHIATADLTLADLPPSGAPYERLLPFALSIDGYLWAAATGYDPKGLAEEIDRTGHDVHALDELRIAAFYWQRCEKWASSDWEARKYIPKVRSAIEAIRRTFSILSP